MSIRKSKGQTFSLDFLVASSIFLIAFTILIFYWQNVRVGIEETQNRDDMTSAANFVLLAWFNDGYPEYWNADDVISLGLQNDERFNYTKVSQLNSMGYNRVREILGVSTYDVYMRVYNSTNTAFEFGIQKPSSNYVTRLSRYGIMNGSIYKVEVIISK